MYLHPPKISNKKPKLHHQQPPDRLKILSLATKKPPLSMNKNPNFLPHSLQGMSLELSIMDMDDKLVAKGNVSLSTMEMDDKLVAKVNCTTRLEGEIKFSDNNIAYQTILQSTSSNPKPDKASRQMDKKIVKNQDSKKVAVGPKGQPSRRNKRKGENPKRIPQNTDSGFSGTLICRNSACGAVRCVFYTFCKRCSCYICHSFDNNKDPSLWLECASDSPSESCGSSCHVECAFQRGRVGVVDHGQGMRLDGGYCCASCGRRSGILGYWKRQLTIAKECRSVDILCHRIDLCFRLLDGTSRFKNLHKFVIEAKNKLEAEVGPLDRVHAKGTRFIVSKLSVLGEVQALCNAALQKADEFSATRSSALGGKEGSVLQMEGTSGAIDAEPDSMLKVQDSSRKLPQPTWVDVEELSGLGHMVRPDTSKADVSPSTSNGLDRNIIIVPDTDDEAAPNDIPRDEAENLDQHGPNVEVAAVNPQAGMTRDRPANTEAHDSDNLDQKYEYFVLFRKLEREGHITKEFRQKLFTWFSLSSTEHERTVINAFVRILGDDPQSLGEQLVDSFGDIVNSKRPRT
ncbi:putative oberon, PHD finger domain, vernalization insensitive 3 [Helianthus debilis subsp. tardiflorus]